MILLLIVVFLAIVVCTTIIVVFAMAMYHNRPTEAVKAKWKLEIEQTKTAIEMEKWKQDWILDHRNSGEKPALPPGTQTVEQPRYTTHVEKIRKGFM